MPSYRHVSVRNFQQADAFLGKRASKLCDVRTRLYRASGDEIRIIYCGIDIVRYFSNGETRLYNGGRTRWSSIKNRLKKFSGALVIQKKWVWYWKAFFDGGPFQMFTEGVNVGVGSSEEAIYLNTAKFHGPLTDKQTAALSFLQEFLEDSKSQANQKGL